MSKNRKFTIIGAGGHARSILDSLRSNGEVVHSIIDLDYITCNEFIMDIPVSGGYENLFQKFNPQVGSLALAIGNNIKREKAYNAFLSLGYDIPTITHSSALVSPSAVINDGCFIGAGTIINAMATIGRNTIINTGTIIEHESSIGSHSHIAPGVTVAGRVWIGDRGFIGAGSTIIQKVKIKEEVTVGAGSVVIRNVDKGRTVAGIPAKVI